MKRYSLFVVFAALVLACDPAPQLTDNEPVSFGFVTLLGDDTLAMEDITVSDNHVKAELVLRAPEVRRAVYEMDLNGMEMSGMTSVWLREGDTLYTEKYTPLGDSIRYERISDQGMQSLNLAADLSAVPFIDMIHWPFEVMSTRLGGDTTEFQVFSGRRGFSFRLWMSGEENMIIRHPTRGEMDVKVDMEGHIQSLNASRTTRALTVSRTEPLSIREWEAEFLRKEREMGPIGGLSGRGSGAYEVKDAVISLDYGQPLKRGRNIWGGLVKYGDLWRTGANRATHLTTTADIRLGELEVPAGEYTLFSIPEKDKLVLIVNRQTGQNGQQYDTSQDLGRAMMQFRETDEIIEALTIDVADENGQNLLRLRWDKGEYVIPIEVK